MLAFLLMSHKGGVGKSTLAVALGNYLSRPPSSQRVCLIEFDLLSPGFSYMLDFTGPKGLYINHYIEAYRGLGPQKDIEQYLWDVNGHGNGSLGRLAVIPAIPDLTPMRQVLGYLHVEPEAGTLAELFKHLVTDVRNAGFDVIVCDFHPGWHGLALVVFASALEIPFLETRPILCASSDRQSLVGGLATGRMVRMALARNAPASRKNKSRFCLVVNRVLDPEQQRRLKDRDNMQRELHRVKGAPGMAEPHGVALAIAEVSQLRDYWHIEETCELAGRVADPGRKTLASLEKCKVMQSVCRGLVGGEHA